MFLTARNSLAQSQECVLKARQCSGHRCGSSRQLTLGLISASSSSSASSSPSNSCIGRRESELNRQGYSDSRGTWLQSLPPALKQIPPLDTFPTDDPEVNILLNKRIVYTRLFSRMHFHKPTAGSHLTVPPIRCVLARVRQG